MKASIRPESTGVQTEHALSKPTSTAVAHNDAAYYDSNERDTIVPVLGLINKIGPLSDAFPKNAGEFAFNRRLVIGTPYTGPGALPGEFGVNVIPLKAEKYYVETYRNGLELKFGVKVEPPVRMFATANAAYQAGYAIDFDAPKLNNVEEAATLVFLVAGPKDDPEDAFFLQIRDLWFTPVVYSVRRASLRDVYRNVNTWVSRPGSKYHNKLCTLSSKFIKNEARKQSWFESRIVATRKLTDEEILRIETAVPAFIRPATPSLPELSAPKDQLAGDPA